MKPAPFEYARPADLDQACAMLAAGDEARVIAGGQSLVPLMAMRLARPKRLIDIARISDLAFGFFCGFGLTHYHLDSRIWRVRHDPGLREALEIA